MQADDHNEVSTPKPKSEPELKGIGGWLILPFIGVIFSALFMPFILWNHNLDVIEY